MAARRASASEIDGDRADAEPARRCGRCGRRSRRGWRSAGCATASRRSPARDPGRRCALLQEGPRAPSAALGRGAALGDRSRPRPSRSRCCRPDGVDRSTREVAQQLLGAGQRLRPAREQLADHRCPRAASSRSAATTSCTSPMRARLGAVEPLGGQEPAPRLARWPIARTTKGAITAGTMPSRTSLSRELRRLAPPPRCRRRRPGRRRRR